MRTVTEHIRKLGVPATQLYTSYYFSNLSSMQAREEGGKLVLSLPLPDDAEIPAFDALQIGLWARVAFRDPKAWAGTSTVY